MRGKANKHQRGNLCSFLLITTFCIILESHYCKSEACMSKYFNAHIHSSDAEVRVKARAEYLKAQLLTQLMWSSSTAKQYLRYNETLNVTLPKKYEKGTLVHISDNLFE